MKRLLSWVLFLSVLAGVGYWNVCEYKNLNANLESLERMQTLVDFSKFERRVNELGSFRSQQVKFAEPYYNYLIHRSAEEFFAGFSEMQRYYREEQREPVERLPSKNFLPVGLADLFMRRRYERQGHRSTENLKF